MLLNLTPPSPSPSMADILLQFLLLSILTLSLLIFLKLIIRPHPTKIPIKSRHIFITGGSTGIGLELARQSAREGAHVTILARDVHNLEKAKESIRLSTGVDVDIVSADVRDFEGVKEAVESVGPIDVLVCSHGVYVPREVVDLEMEMAKEMIDVNLVGSVNLVKAVLPGMKGRSDRKPVSIAFMSSQAGQVGVYGYAVYSASKFGLRGLAEALQQEVIADDIHVSLIFPPETDTPGLTKAKSTMPQLTNIIAASSSAMKADEVAKKALDGIKSGSFFIFCNLEGFLLSIITAGFAPQRSYLMAFIEVIFGGFVRIGALYCLRIWYGTIDKMHTRMK